MTDRMKTASGPGFDFFLYARGKNAVQLDLNGIPRLLMGRVTLEEKFSETGALEKKLRRHDSVDMLSIGLESLNVLPFGCEYAISRNFEITDGFAEFADDIAALHHGRVGSLELEPMTFTGSPAAVSFILPGESTFRTVALKEAQELYSGSTPLLMLEVTWADGAVVSYSTGTDLWRHGAAGKIRGASAGFTLAFDGEMLVYERKVLIYSEETEPEKRPWRFKNLLAWRTEKAVTLPETDASFAVTGCQVNPAARRDVRKKVRSGRGNMLMTGISPRICAEGSHVEKPGKTGYDHFDLAEYVSFRLWANRQLMKNGGSLVMQPEKENIFINTAAVQNLSSVPRPLEFCSEVEDV